MATHQDIPFPQIIDAQIGKPSYQVCVLLSRKKTDFFTGGGVISDSQKQKVDSEPRAASVRWFFFDGRTYHGVEDVDLDRVIDFSSPDGRLAALVNLYSAA
jgi:hypothetical protein